jgi:formylglycine-generating enzyme required for sulfatase activity
MELPSMTIRRHLATLASVLAILPALWPAHAEEQAARPAVQLAQLGLTDPAEYRRREILRHLAEEVERRRTLEAQAQQAREQEERNRQYQREQAEYYRRRDAEIEEQSRRNREFDESIRLFYERQRASDEQLRLQSEIRELRYRLERERQQHYAPAPIYQPPPDPWAPLPGMQTQPTPRGPQPVVALSGGYPSPGAAFRDRRSDGQDCPECPELVVIPAGAYAMGASAEEERQENLPTDLRGRALPVTRIAIAQSFAVARTEVTREQYAAFVAATGRAQSGGCIVYRRNPANGAFEWRRDPGASWNAPGFTQTDRDPVVCVSHADAGAYVQWLSDRTGYRYRLLSEAEWEYAGRAGTRTPRWWQGRADEACANANVADRDAAQALAWAQAGVHPCSDRHSQTAPAGSFAANRFGLHDMLGNVWEWTEDCWNDSHAGRPGDAQVRHAGACERRVIRGGAWNDTPMVVRSGFRDWAAADSRSDVIGLRVAREIPGVPQVSARLPR